jgi:nicotinate phosphoribosyltransferase
VSTIRDVYRPSLATLTDLYELTMAAGYVDAGMADREAVFNLTFRARPFRGGYAVAAGLADAIELLDTLRFAPEDLDHLAAQRAAGGGPLFKPEFLERLATFRFSGSVDAIPEGTLVFPHEPLVRVRGPLLEAQLAETMLLTIIGFQTLVATKAARIVDAADGDPVLEFGLRRAQGVDGGLSVSRAAWIGGVAATSNVLAGRLYDIPVRGTHAHSWVQAFGDETVAFDAWADAMPGNAVLLVDTYDTLTGVSRAIETGRRLRESGHDLTAIRLDSGDLAYLSIEARKLLDEAGFTSTRIIASNDLDEGLIASLKGQGARIDTWGVGTKLATCYDQPALGAVYKLSAIRDADGSWRYPVKLSEQLEKVSIPGILGVRRYTGPDGLFRADAIYDEAFGVDDGDTIICPWNLLRRYTIDGDHEVEELLRPVLRDGDRVTPAPSLDDIRARVRAQLGALHPTIRRLLNPHDYPVGLESQVHERRTTLALAAKGSRPRRAA